MNRLRFGWQDDTGEHDLVMVWVPGTNGSPYEFGRGIHSRAIDLAGFFIATTPVTQALWRRVMGSNPAVRPDARCPVENVSWDQVTARGGFLDRLNSSEIRSAMTVDHPEWRFRLPSESEWEYAARGGPRWRDGFAFSGSNDPDAVAWYGPRWTQAHQLIVQVLGWRRGWRLANRFKVRRPTRTHPVGAKAPNQLGLYDMSGNVWEWCEDVCTEDPAAIPADGRPFNGPGQERRLRGGCHHNWDLHCTVTWRYGIQPDAHDGCIGFRVVLARSRFDSLMDGR